MKVLPNGWELECMKKALADAGYAHAERRGTRGTPMLTFNYGPTPGEQLWMTVQAGPGAMLITAHNLVAAKDPSPAQLASANDVNIDWPFGKLYWEADEFRASVTLFAYPDFPPPGADIRLVCHQLWLARGNLSQLEPGVPPEPPEGPSLPELVQMMEQWTKVKWRQKDARFITRLDCGDGTCGLTLTQTGPGDYLFDVMPLAAEPWPDDLESWKRLNGVSARLLRGAATRWDGGRVIVRDPWPWPLIVADHPEWAGLMFDHAITAAETVTRASRVTR